METAVNTTLELAVLSDAGLPLTRSLAIPITANALTAVTRPQIDRRQPAPSRLAKKIVMGTLIVYVMLAPNVCH